MATHGLNHVNIRAHRELLDELKDFYCDVLSLKEGFRPPFPGFGYWLYAGDTAVIHLYEAEPDEVRQREIPTHLDHFAFECSNRSEIEETLSRHGVSFHRSSIPATSITQLFVLDPAGNRVELNFATSTT